MLKELSFGARKGMLTRPLILSHKISIYVFFHNISDLHLFSHLLLLLQVGTKLIKFGIKFQVKPA